MQYSARNLAACLLAIYTHETLAIPQAFPVQSSNVSSETTVPIATSAEAPVSLRPLAGLASSAVDGAATLVTTTSELIPLIPQTSTTAEASVVSQVQSTEVTSAATATFESSSLTASNTAVAEDSAFPSSVALETTATEPSTTETATADATSTSGTSGFLASVVTESSTSASSAVAETSRAAKTSRPSGFFPITNGTAPGASGVAGGKPHGTGAAHQSLVTDFRAIICSANQ
ncbi:hypothetical protein N0V85_000361 [Neurospora sp. IMI 360204]|nr:hypothetical protein N0V85_000361 [Neurospora sp. IMI 360204]